PVMLASCSRSTSSVASISSYDGEGSPAAWVPACPPWVALSVVTIQVRLLLSVSCFLAQIAGASPVLWPGAVSPVGVPVRPPVKADLIAKGKGRPARYIRA